MMGTRGGRPLPGDLGTAMRMAFVALQCNSLTPLGVEKGFCAPDTARKGFRCMLFICAVTNRGVWVLFKRKGACNHYKGGLASDCTAPVVSARKADVNRWQSLTHSPRNSFMNIQDNLMFK